VGCEEAGVEEWLISSHDNVQGCTAGDSSSFGEKVGPCQG